jgi:hypothetical protein
LNAKNIKSNIKQISKKICLVARLAGCLVEPRHEGRPDRLTPISAVTGKAPLGGSDRQNGGIGVTARFPQINRVGAARWRALSKPQATSIAYANCAPILKE